MIKHETWTCALRARGGRYGRLFSGVHCGDSAMGRLAEMELAEDVHGIIDLHREMSELRPFRPIPL